MLSWLAFRSLPALGFLPSSPASLVQFPLQVCATLPGHSGLVNCKLTSYPFLHILSGWSPSCPQLQFFYLFIYLLYSRFLLIIYFIYISEYMSIPIYQFTPQPRFPTLVSIRLFTISVSLFLSCKLVHLYYFSRFHIYALICNICFSLSDLLHSVWQSLDPSTPLQMTKFHSF